MIRINLTGVNYDDFNNIELIYIIEDLTINTLYNISLSAYTSAGRGDIAENIEKTNEDGNIRIMLN